MGTPARQRLKHRPYVANKRLNQQSASRRPSCLAGQRRVRERQGASRWYYCAKQCEEPAATALPLTITGQSCQVKSINGNQT